MLALGCYCNLGLRIIGVKRIPPMKSTFPDGSNVFAKQDENACLIWLKGEKTTREDEVKNDQHDAAYNHGHFG